MKILVYGDAKHVGSGSWCYAQTLLEMGLEVFEFQDTFGLDRYRSKLFWRGIYRIKRLPLRKHISEHSNAFIEKARSCSPDIVIVSKGLFVSKESILALKMAGAWVVNLNHDDFFSLYRNNWSVLQRAAIPAYDHIFSTRMVNVSEIRPINANVDFLPFSYYPRIHRPVELTKADGNEYSCDVLFVGTWARARCRLLEKLVRRVGANYAIYGSHWEKVGRNSVLAPFIKGRVLGPDEMAKAMGAAKISLGFLRKENRDDYTQRTFEIPACGGVFLGERTAEHSRLLKEGVEAEFFDPDSPEELVLKVVSLLKDDAKRERMRELGRKAIEGGKHTYKDRMELLLGHFKIWKDSPEGKARKMDRQ
jgi:spore maturation protein CgeB